jgi:nitrite reductase/ring-hydroxylating ferredoxin subunit
MKTLADNKGNSNKLKYLCRVSGISQGKSKTFTIAYDKDTKKIEIALFNIEGKFYAIPNRCAHDGGPLSGGVLEGHIVTCPWHGWKYSVIDGNAPHEGGDSVSSYETKVIGEGIYVNTSSLI